ncbi:histone deacetylase [Chloroflexota bacterium]
MEVGLIYDSIYLKHDTGTHVENSRRLIETMAILEKSHINDKLVLVSPRAALVDELLMVHSQDHISRVQGLSMRGGGWLDGDTVASPDSYEVALHAAGGLLCGVDGVMNGDMESAFALVRPPGHHATPQSAMGFCLFNNVAIAARYALSKYNLERVLIADFDVHHGNGTQDVFYDDPRVLYFSTHEYPWYPGSGDVDEDGHGAGKGANINVPLPAYCGDEQYLRAFREILEPVAKRFQPQIILVSAGYDTHWADPLSMMQVTTAGFGSMVGILSELAMELCQGRLLLTLEGGYHLEALSHSIKRTLEVMMEVPQADDPLGAPREIKSPDIDRVLEAVKKVHKLT